MNYEPIFCDEPLFGCHMSCNANLSQSLKECANQGVYVPQFFFGNPYSLNRRTHSDKEIKECNQFLAHSGLSVFTHLPYVINLAGNATTKTIAYYDGDESVDEKVEACVESIDKELKEVSRLKCQNKGCVLHIGSVGSGGDSEKGCDAVSQSINKLRFEGDTPLLLETMVGRGGVLGKSFEELASVYSKVENRAKVGFCLDTCHVFAEGLFDLGTIEGIDSCFESFDQTIGLNKLNLVHLNDSMCEHSSHQDRHSRIGGGFIWRERLDAFRYFFKKCRGMGIPMVLETELQDVVNVYKLLRE